MTTFGKMLGLVLVILLAVAARVDADPPVPATQKDLEAFQSQLDALKKRVDDMPTEMDVKIQNALKKTNEKLDNLERLLKSSPHVSRSSPLTEAAPISPPPPSSRLQLVNDYLMPMDVMVNMQRYTLQPGETREIKMAPGPFTYRVINVQGDTASVLRPNEVLKITMYQRCWE